VNGDHLQETQRDCGGRQAGAVVGGGVVAVAASVAAAGVEVEVEVEVEFGVDFEVGDADGDAGARVMGRNVLRSKVCLEGYYYWSGGWDSRKFGEFDEGL
jgi:hypothetical protein